MRYTSTSAVLMHTGTVCAPVGVVISVPPVKSTMAAMQQYIAKTVVLTLCSSASKAIYITALFYGQPTAQVPCRCTTTHRTVTMTLIVFSRVSLRTEGDYFFPHSPRLLP